MAASNPKYQLRACVDINGDVRRPEPGEHPEFWSLYEREVESTNCYFWLRDYPTWRAAFSDLEYLITEGTLPAARY